MTETEPTLSHDDEPFDLEREPLDRPAGLDHDWGGDGTDLSRPVRAHVLTALRVNSEPYSPTVDALRELGDPREDGAVERRQALGLGQQHLPELLRMLRDRALYTADSDTDEVWAPLHALQALSDLDTSAAVPEIIPLLDLEDDWYSTEVPNLLGKLGTPAIEPLRAYLADHTRWAFGHSAAARALEQIGKQHPELREQVVSILSDVLRDAEHYDEVTNTGAMGALVELDAVEALPLIRRAFELGQIDEMVYGPWGDVLEDLGLEPEEDDPLVEESRRRFDERHERFMPKAKRDELLQLLDSYKARSQAPGIVPAPPATRNTAQQQARKAKNKRKAASAARKANRRKRK